MLKQWFERAMHEDFNELVTIDTYHGLVNKISKKVFGELLTDQTKKWFKKILKLY